MPRIKGLGELDWYFDDRIVPNPLIVIKHGLPHAELVDFISHLVLTSASPIELNANDTVREMRLRLTFDCPPFGQEEWGGYDNKLGWCRQYEGGHEGSEKELTLPINIRNLLVKFCQSINSDAVCYDWDGGKNLIFFTTLDIDSTLVIRNFHRFLEALARKMSKWYKEACQTV